MRKLIEDQKNKEEEAHVATGKREVFVSRDEIKKIRQAQTVVSTAIHPDTGEFIPWVCRLSSFLHLAQKIGKVVTLEEGCLMGGFGSAVLEALNDANVLAPVYRIGVPDILVEHASPEQSFNSLGLSSGQICDRILNQFAFNKQTVISQ